MEWKNIKSDYASRLDALAQLPPHELLGVPADATVDEIKNAYRDKVKLYHPDKTDEFMKRYGERVVGLLNEAKRILLENKCR